MKAKKTDPEKINLIFKKTVWKYVLALWVSIWMLVFFKNLFFKGYIKDYGELLKRKGLEEKRSFVTGDHLYGLVKFCKVNLPEGATFGYKGIEDDSLSDRQFQLYLYPCLKSDNPDYLIVYGEKAPSDARPWRTFKRLDGTGYILKKVEG